MKNHNQYFNNNMEHYKPNKEINKKIIKIGIYIMRIWSLLMFQNTLYIF